VRRIVWLLLVLMLGAGAAAAQDSETPRRAVEGEACPVALPDWASAPEQWAWAQICAGEIADMSLSTGADDGAGCDAVKEDQPWPDSRVLSPRFIRLITAREPYISASVSAAVNLRCARFDEQVYLVDEFVPKTLDISYSRAAMGFNTMGAKFGRDLSITFSNLYYQPIVAWEMAVAGNLNLTDSIFGQTYLLYSSVGGYLDASNSTFDGEFNAGDLEVSDHLFLSESVFADVDLPSASVEGNIVANGTQFEGHLRASSLVVGGNVTLKDKTSFSSVNLSDASVDGSFYVDGATFSGLLDARMLRNL
jgi:hypothetical protein